MDFESRYHAALFRRSQNQELYLELGKFRKALFVDLLKWDLQTSQNREEDAYDHAAAHYAVLQCDMEIVGGFRAIRTDKPYLAKGVFPQLATLKDYPCRPDVWEISRFGVAPSSHYLKTAARLYALMFQFALMHNARSLVAVTDLVHERYLLKRNIRTRRFGLPQQFATGARFGKFQLVAGEIPISEQDPIHLQNLMSNLNGVSIDDKALVLGRSRLQA